MLGRVVVLSVVVVADVLGEIVDVVTGAVSDGAATTDASCSACGSSLTDVRPKSTGGKTGGLTGGRTGGCASNGPPPIPAVVASPGLAGV